MEQLFIQKDGLLYTPDEKTVIGVDIENNTFTGKIPYGAVSIDDEVFTGCPYENITVPDSVKGIGYRAFAECNDLQTVKLPAEIKDLPPYLFTGCSSLTKVYMPNELNGFPEGLFYGCSSMEEIPFRAGIKELPEEVFANCTSLRSLVIPNTVERIETKACSGCSSLTALVLPSSLQYLAEDAFEGCNSLHNIRIDQDNKIFFVNEEDGCLYEHTAEGDKLRIPVTSVLKQEVAFFKENVDDESDDFFSDEDFDEIDETFSSEVSATDEETKEFTQNELSAALQETEALGLAEEETAMMMDNMNTQDTNELNTEEPVTQAPEENIMEAPAEQNVDGMLKDIMDEQKERTDNVPDVSVDQNETEVLTKMMDVMNDAPIQSTDAKVSDDELLNLFSAHEREAKPEKLDNTEQKIKILTDSVTQSQILEFNPSDECLTNPDLFVIAEHTVSDKDGNKVFTPKLIRCCNTFARIQCFRRVILLNGLPFENQEFQYFYSSFMKDKNIVLACEAQSPATLSDYAKQICAESFISLEKQTLISQRKNICTKNNSIIKLVIKDIYDI